MIPLPTQLREAAAGSRELDREIWEAFGYTTWQGEKDGKWWLAKEPELSATAIPHVTGSIDAALALIEEVLPGWDWYRDPPPIQQTALVSPEGIVPRMWYFSAHKSPALALCLALLSAVEGGSDG